MCGIAGILDTSHQSVITPALLQSMGDTMPHRGPDDSGVYVNPSHTLGFAFRRLAIIDLSANGHQPMTTADGRYTIVFNGEIYNHRSIRAELEQKGYHYHSQTDTETILYGYAEWGAGILQKMNGMWGLAIWDDLRKELFVARDRVGVKPVYYTSHNHRFAFASEIKALLALPFVKRAVNEAELANYMAFSISGFSTMFQDIHKLRAGHYCVVHADGTHTIKEYWNPLDRLRREGNPQHLTFHEAQTEIMRILRCSVADRMMSDVPFGVFLSGGIDSSLNVALMSELMDRPVQTFSVGFTRAEAYNELDYARLVAEHYRTDHHEIEIDYPDAEAVFESLVWHEDEPNADPVCIPLWYVSKLARESGTIVVQVGEGSDEQFAGYHFMHRDIQFYKTYWRAYTALPRFLRSALYAMSAPLFRRVHQYHALEYLRRASHDDELYWGGVQDITPAQQYELLAPNKRVLADVPAQTGKSFHDSATSRVQGLDYLQRMSYAEFMHRLPELLLMRVDKIGMAHSIEARVPFLDYRLVEFSMMLPEAIKIPQKGITKSLLKSSAESILPHNIIYRKKQGFAAPVDEWFRGAGAGYVKSTILSSPYIMQSGLFDPSAVRSFISAHQHGTYKFGRSLFALMQLALWHKRWF